MEITKELQFEIDRQVVDKSGIIIGIIGLLEDIIPNTGFYIVKSITFDKDCNITNITFKN